MSSRDLFLAIDVGTGSVRSALVDTNGNLVAFQTKEHDQIVPRPGWAEQRPSQWWEGAVETTRAVLQSVAGAADGIAAIAACGQMHATVLIDAAGEPVLDAVPLWNDKRTRDLVARVQRDQAVGELLQITANPPTVAWQAFKLAWIKENHPEAYRRAATLLMPKDYINFKLTGERAVDYPEAFLQLPLQLRRERLEPKGHRFPATQLRIVTSVKAPGGAYRASIAAGCREHWSTGRDPRGDWGGRFS